MSLDGNGTYDPLAPPDFPAVSGDTILASAYNAQILDMVSALNTAFYRDGQAAATGNWNLASFRITDLGAATAVGDALSLNSTKGITLPGTANRINADFNNGTRLDRAMFQSTSAGATSVGVLPAGTNAADFTVYNEGDPSDCSTGTFGINLTEVQIIAGKVATGSYLPMKFYTNNSVILTLDVTGEAAFGGAVSAIGDVSSATSFTCQSDKVIGARVTTGAASASGGSYTALTGSSSTAEHLETLRFIIEGLYAHGLFGA